MRLRLHDILTWGQLLLALVAAQKNVINETALAELSPCVVQCAAEVISKYSCFPTDPCFCEDEHLNKDIVRCVLACPFEDQLAASHFQGSTCQRPVRSIQRLAPMFYVLYGTATIFTLARIISRLRTFGGAGLGWDDFTAVLSFIPLTGLTICDWYTIHYGGGTDIWGLTMPNVYRFVFWFYLDLVFYVPVPFLTKISLVCLYLRIWDFESSFRVACRITLAVLVVAFVAFQVVVILQCTPIDFQWARLIDAERVGTCINREAWGWSIGFVVIALDLLVLLLPCPILLRLEVPTTRKIGLCAVFLVGLVVTTFSCVRLDFVRGIETTPNPTMFLGYLGIYSNVEAHLSQICCCMPTIPGIVRRSYRYVRGRTVTESTSSMPLRNYRETTPNPKPLLHRDDSHGSDRTRTGSRFSTFSEKDTSLASAPAPVIHRYSSPLPRGKGPPAFAVNRTSAFPRYMNRFSETQAVFSKDYRNKELPQPGHDREEDEDDLILNDVDLALPPPVPRK